MFAVSFALFLALGLLPFSANAASFVASTRNHQLETPLLMQSTNTPLEQDQQKETFLTSQESYDYWLSRLDNASKPYVGTLFTEEPQWQPFLDSLLNTDSSQQTKSQQDTDPLWNQVKLEAMEALQLEPEAGPQLYQSILSQPNLLEALVTSIANEIETPLIQATAFKNLFLSTLSPLDEVALHLDIMAVANRSEGNVMTAVMFHKGLHAIVCHRVSHNLWLDNRKGLASYMQSTVSQKYSADVHPACIIGAGIYLNAGGGIVIGETARVGQDVSILQGVTLGGTGTEKQSDRHPKIGNGVLLKEGSTVLGNIKVEDGAVVMPKSIVTKPVPPLAKVSGIPAKIIGYRELTDEEFDEDVLEYHLGVKYREKWQALRDAMEIDDEEKQPSKS